VSSTPGHNRRSALAHIDAKHENALTAVAVSPVGSKEERAMIELLDDMPEGVLGFRAEGQIAADDYTDVLKPAIDDVLRRGDDVRIVLVFDDWPGMTGGAVWEDMKMGIERFTKWKRIALVTDVEWMRHATSLFGWMTPGDVKTFTLAERDAAVAWAAG
jgi:hypothetical protein